MNKRDGQGGRGGRDGRGGQGGRSEGGGYSVASSSSGPVASHPRRAIATVAPLWYVATSLKLTIAVG